MQSFFDNQHFFYFNPDKIILISNVYNFPQTIDKQIKNLQSYMQNIRSDIFEFVISNLLNAWLKIKSFEVDLYL